MSHARVKEIERQRAEALEGLKRAIEDDFNAVQDAYWFSVSDCKDYVQCWIDSGSTERLINAMVDGDGVSIVIAQKSMQLEVDDLVARYALERGRLAINDQYDSLLEDLTNG